MPAANRAPLDAALDPDAAWEIRAGYAHAAVGICSLAAYPIGAILLKAKCGWSCIPTVSDVERPLDTGTDVWTVDVMRRALIMSAVILRVVLVPTVLLQVFPLLRPPPFKSWALHLVRFVFYISLAFWTVSDLFQVFVGNDLKHRADYTPHTLAAHLDVFALVVCHIVLLVTLAADTESGKRWLVTGSLALCKLSAAALFLAVRLSTNSVMWQFIEWAMLGAIGGLHLSIGLAMPAGMKLNLRRLRVSRTSKSSLLVGPGYDALGQTWASSH